MPKGSALGEALTCEVLDACRRMSSRGEPVAHDLLVEVNAVCTLFMNPGMTMHGLRSLVYEARRWQRVLLSGSDLGLDRCAAALERWYGRLKKQRKDR